jgi:hypothetical protein
VEYFLLLPVVVSVLGLILKSLIHLELIIDTMGETGI